MGLEQTFQRGAEKVFAVFKDAVRQGIYYSILDTGFDEDNSTFPVRVIEESFTEKDIKYLSFSEYIQPNDVKGIMLGVDLKAEIHAQSDKVEVTQKDGVTKKTYTVVDFSRDPLGIVYTFLLRKT